jgi:hypothetical protein
MNFPVNKICHRNTFLVIAVLFVVLFGYWFSTKEQGSMTKGISDGTISEAEIYERNRDCLEYKKQITDKLETKDSPFGKTSLEQIFYSTKLETCLYVEFSQDGPFYNRRLLDIRNDGYNSEPVTMCASVYPDNILKEKYENDGYLELYNRMVVACDRFDSELNSYK